MDRVLESVLFAQDKFEVLGCCDDMKIGHYVASLNIQPYSPCFKKLKMDQQDGVRNILQILLPEHVPEPGQGVLFLIQVALYLLCDFRNALAEHIA